MNGSNGITHLLTGNHQSYTLTNADIESIEEEPENVGEKTNKVEEGGRILFVNMEEEVLRQNEIEIRRVEEASGEAKFEDVVPKEYWEFKEEVFDKKAFDKLLPRRSWDYAIKLIPEATLKDCKVYPLSVKEQKELDCFLDKHLKTECIRPSKSPCTTPFFFVKKKMAHSDQSRTIDGSMK